MAGWLRKYSDRERAALERAGCDMRVRPFRRIVELAAAGRLPVLDGEEPVAAFEIPESTVRAIVRSGDAKRQGLKLRAELARLPADDRATVLERRLAALVDLELQRLEQRALTHQREPIDLEQCRRLARTIRELRAMPAKGTGPAPRAPGQRAGDGTSAPDKQASPSSLAGQILRASDAHATRTGTGTAPDSTTDATNTADSTSTTDTTDTHNDTHDAHDGPGSAPGEVGAGLVAESVVVAG
jgi:hypothetical protein